MNDPPIEPDLLAIAVALCSNPEAYKAASMRFGPEYVLRREPCDTLADQALAIVRRLRHEQRYAEGARH